MHADLLVFNAVIYTVDREFSIAEAMVVKDGKILDIGKNKEIYKKYDASHIIDAEGKTIIPGLIDPHCHFLELGKSLHTVDLVGSKSMNEIVDRALHFHQTHPDKFIIGRGWDQNLWEDKNFPNNHHLNHLFPDVPVILIRIDSHAALVNDKALKMANFNTETQIEGGKLLQEKGQLTGLVLDNAMKPLLDLIPKPGFNTLRMYATDAEHECVKYGITSVGDAYIDSEMIDLFEKLHQSNELNIRIYAMVYANLPNLISILDNRLIQNEKLNVAALKLFADGALGSHGALLRDPYSDKPETNGIKVDDTQRVLEVGKIALNYNLQLNVHCIGDWALNNTLDAFEKLINNTQDHRWRIEHLQIADDTQLNRMKNLGVLASIQPTHGTSDMEWAGERLGEERLRISYPLRRVIDILGSAALGTDFPIENVNPFFTFFSAIERKNPVTHLGKDFLQAQKITREEALRGMTIWSAFAQKEENIKGSLEKGKLADFVILDRNIMTIEAEEIPKTKSFMTFIGGKKVYQGKN